MRDRSSFDTFVLIQTMSTDFNSSRRAGFQAKCALSSAIRQLRPVVKWAGGKSKLVETIRANMPTHVGRYFEPFLGGGALYLAVQPERATLSDANPDLIGMYEALKRDPNAFIEVMTWHRRHHGAGHFEEVKRRFNDPPITQCALERAVAFLYLNRACYNGLWRVNASGRFNVGFGRQPRLSFDESNARQVAAMLRSATIVACGYERALRKARAGDFIYLDPPYLQSSSAEFASYTAGGFGREEHAHLADTAIDLVSRGCYVIASNSSQSSVRELYGPLFRPISVQAARPINSNPAGRGHVKELLLVSKNITSS